MSFSDAPFAYGPFVPHHIPRQYIESYFSHHKTDSLLSLSTTVEDISVIKTPQGSREKWRLTLRKYDAARLVDVWWEEEFDAVVLANGHYSVPFVRKPTSPKVLCRRNCLTCMKGTRSKRSYTIHGTVSGSRGPFQDLPNTAGIPR